MLRVWFYDPTNDKEGLFKLVAFSDPPYCHCELQFPDTMTCSIYMGTTVSLKKRASFGDCYTELTLPSTREQSEIAYQVCNNNFEAKQQFSAIEMLSCFSPWKSSHQSRHNQYTFCSKLIAEALQAAEIYPINLSTAISPSLLYRTLVSQTCTIPTYSDKPTPVFDANIQTTESQTRNSKAMIIDFYDPSTTTLD